MLCAVYKSLKKDRTYLYVQRRDDFSAVPEALLKTFGTPTLVTIVNLAKREHLALADIDRVRQQLTQHGFYLQLPPPEDNLLAQHKANQSA
ncbi:YcgL domain-containing protein [Rheinheimera maricola]|uniref:YcgL domain-containing protein I4W93_009860 n=1 Tax=Rheinheimera maricola TaxID=2793282 RepID=A0ABS7X8P1_9GAMM|nr:YcgL domain-containing protein [Rheinheimera maricola]MBZ9611899.1 YcgL domain-containing protein [Rheinheimera maricola]